MSAPVGGSKEDEFAKTAYLDQDGFLTLDCSLASLNAGEVDSNGVVSVDCRSRMSARFTMTVAHLTHLVQSRYRIQVLEQRCRRRGIAERPESR